MPSFLDAASTGRTILDVGTGTGRAALALAVRGARVTGVDASRRDARGGRAPGQRRGHRASRSRGRRARASNFPIASFDAVVCLRVLMHTPDWRRSLAELCRVARDRVVFDYPALSSAAALQAVTRHVAPRARRARSRPTACSLVARSRRRSRANGFRLARHAPPVRAADRAAQAPELRRRRPSGSKARSRAPA